MKNKNKENLENGIPLYLIYHFGFEIRDEKTEKFNTMEEFNKRWGGFLNEEHLQDLLTTGELCPTGFTKGHNRNVIANLGTKEELQEHFNTKILQPFQELFNEEEK
jgi:hypothetical protein